MLRPLRFGSPFLLIAAAGAQVPVGSAIVSTLSNPTGPLVVLDRGSPPSVRSITGGTLSEINAVRIDPATGFVWMTAIDSGALRLGIVDFASSRLVNDGPVATLPVDALAGIAFDIDGNPVVGGGSLDGTGGVWRVHRATGAITPLVDNASLLTGEVNALHEDLDTGNVYFGVHGTGNVYRIGPPYTLNSQVLVGSIASFASSQLSGVSFARSASVPQGLLYVSSFAASRNASVVTMDVVTGAVNVIPGTPTWFDVNALDHDAVRNDLWVGSTFAARSLAHATTAGAITPLHQLASGFATGIDANDVDTTKAKLRIFPRNVPVPTAPFRLDLSVFGNPGEIAVIAVTLPTDAVLAIGNIAADGHFGITVNSLIFPAGAPGTLVLLGGTVDPTRLIAKISDPVSWPIN